MATVDLRQSTIFSRLRGLLEVTRLVRTSEELPELLAAIARTISDSLAFQTVVINLYRREWDDEKKCFKPTAVHDWTSHPADSFRYLAQAWRSAPRRPVAAPKQEGWVIPPPRDQRHGGIHL